MIGYTDEKHCCCCGEAIYSPAGEHLAYICASQVETSGMSLTWPNLEHIIPCCGEERCRRKIEAHIPNSRGKWEMIASAKIKSNWDENQAWRWENGVVYNKYGRPVNQDKKHPGYKTYKALFLSGELYREKKYLCYFCPTCEYSLQIKVPEEYQKKPYCIMPTVFCKDCETILLPTRKSQIEKESNAVMARRGWGFTGYYEGYFNAETGKYDEPDE